MFFLHLRKARHTEWARTSRHLGADASHHCIRRAQTRQNVANAERGSGSGQQAGGQSVLRIL